MAQRHETVRLSGGPGHGQVFYVEDWEERRRAAERMGRTPDDVRGWALGYRPDLNSPGLWIWTGDSASSSGYGRR